MANVKAKSPRVCIYCRGIVAKERRGEHIIPEAIGGELTLNEVAGKSVCQRCNNGVLSNLDRELCSRSYLSVIASQEIAANLWQVWDIDHSARDLLVEARPYWKEGELRQLICHPQMVFEKQGPQIRGDAEEMEHLGKDRTIDIMMRAVQGAYERFQSGKKGALHFERVRTDLLSRNYRLPPRVYAPRTLVEIENNIRDQSFVFRYLTAEDRAFALASMADLALGNKQHFKRSAQFVGSALPSISIYFDLGLVARAMMKIAMNLLAAYCSRTTVNCDTFIKLTRLIMGKLHPTPRDIAGNGFVHAVDVNDLARPGCHSFRITNLENDWIVYMSFFGGRVGGAVSFPGPNREEWNTLEIVAPIRSKDWTVAPSQLYLPLKVHFDCKNHEAIAPSLKSQYAQMRLLVDEVPAK